MVSFMVCSHLTSNCPCPSVSGIICNSPSKCSCSFSWFNVASVVTVCNEINVSITVDTAPNVDGTVTLALRVNKPLIFAVSFALRGEFAVVFAWCELTLKLLSFSVVRLCLCCSDSYKPEFLYSLLSNRQFSHAHEPSNGVFTLDVYNCTLCTETDTETDTNATWVLYLIPSDLWV